MNISRLPGIALVLLAVLRPYPVHSAGEASHHQTEAGSWLTVEPVVTRLEVPWSLAFSDSDLYFTERPGRLSVLRGMRGSPVLLARLPNVAAVGEGGLMGLALHPGFAANRLLYVSYTVRSGAGALHNRVVRFRVSGDTLADARVILDNLPGGGVHNGCRLAFGPDARLYVTTGDAGRRNTAQDTASQGGKILRLNDDGSRPPDNPFVGSLVYSLGHRNPQGLAWQPGTGALFSSEHGPSGFDGPGGGDEINLIRKGRNYGWPLIHHTQKQTGLDSPLLEVTPAIAPAGMTFVRGSKTPILRGKLLVASLRGEHLLLVTFGADGSVARTDRLFEGELGRLRDVVEGPDGSLYVCTSNRDGRGDPHAEDDRILRITLRK